MSDSRTYLDLSPSSQSPQTSKSIKLPSWAAIPYTPNRYSHEEHFPLESFEESSPVVDEDEKMSLEESGDSGDERDENKYSQTDEGKDEMNDGDDLYYDQSDFVSVLKDF